MNNTQNLDIRALRDSDPPLIASAFAQMGWNKPEARYRQYLDEQSAGTRTCLVAIVDGQFAGYVTVNWRPSYPGFSEQNIPEIQDLNILRQFRRQGTASRLLDHAESEVARHSSVVGIGVGLHPGYNVAQRLYVRRGYIPDGRGVTYRDRYIHEGEHVVLDDELLLHFTKQLSRE
jgi:GNAT superfamily N-acetyltransferase